MHDLLHLRNPPANYQPVEVLLKTSDDFLKVKETLTRIGIASKTSNTLYQSCHILHKQGRYFILSFKELFAIDCRPTDITQNDLQRRNTIACLLDHWGLIELLDKTVCEDKAPMSQIKVVSFSDKKNWIFEAKYEVGQFKK